MRIALTGSIGSGKSSALKIIKDLGFKTLSCDEINAELLEYPHEGYFKIASAFKDCIKGQQVDKKQLAKIVFKNDQELDKLNRLMHPLILKEINTYQDDPLFVEVPLLYESGFAPYFDYVLLIYVDEEIAFQRLLNRGMKYEEALERLRKQMSVAEKLRLCDKAIDNSGDPADLKRAVEDFLKELGYAW